MAMPKTYGDTVSFIILKYFTTSNKEMGGMMY
jgi:hypothetical protein